MRLALRLAAVVLGLTMLGIVHADEGFSYVTSAAGRPAADEVVIDSRPLADCKRATLPKARCLPAEGFLGPHRALPNEREILWLLGTAGLDGSEAVLVVGQDATARDFVAGLLYLAGQRQVRVLTEPVARLVEGRRDAAPGQERGIIRPIIFTAPMRDQRMVLKQELERELHREAAAATLLDGRGELEYWGETVRGARGGHLPGAVLLPATTLAAAGPRPLLPAGNSIAYGHDAYDGLAYFTRLAAGLGIDVRVYPGGWAEWAADGSLPADALTYPERRAEELAAVPPAPTLGASPGASSGASVGVMALATVIALAAFAGGWLLSRKRGT